MRQPKHKPAPTQLRFGAPGPGRVDPDGNVAGHGARASAFALETHSPCEE